ncbi:MAG: hypothetical protein HY744_17745 [Deltaproteobacteria bacterium]|nr:hypothetical protein [Deltaproteobacteria bacterium]
MSFRLLQLPGSAIALKRRALLFAALLPLAAAACSEPCEDLADSCARCTDATYKRSCDATVSARVDAVCRAQLALFQQICPALDAGAGGSDGGIAPPKDAGAGGAGGAAGSGAGATGAEAGGAGGGADASAGGADGG